MLSTVRRRVTLIALVATGLTLATAGFGLLTVLRSSLVDEVDTQISNRAFDIVVEIEVTNTLGNASFPNDPETFVGVIERFATEAPFLDVHNDDSPDVGEILNLTNIDARSGSIELDAPANASLRSVTLTEGADNLRIVFTEVAPGEEVVVVARSLDGVDRTVERVRLGVLFAVPVLTLLVGLLVHALTGRALSPVEAIRSEVETISATDLSKRVPVGERPDEISRLALTMNEMLSRLEAAQDRQRRFTGDAAHELRSPLASMRAGLDVDIAHPETVDWNRSAQHLRNEVDRMQRTVEDLLLLARADGAERLSLASARLVDLDDIVLSTAATISVRDGVEVNTSKVSAAAVRGNADELQRLVNNLLANAIRHASSLVELSVGERDGRAFIIVDDDGDGIAPDDRERVFERFVRLDEARSRDAGGSGLGLALARELAVAHGGSLSADANSRGGARFVVDLPAS